MVRDDRDDQGERRTEPAAADGPPTERPPTERPPTERPTAERPTAERPTAERPAEQPTTRPTRRRAEDRPADRRVEDRRPEGAMGTLLTLRPHLERLTGALQAAHSAMALQCAVTSIGYFHPGVKRLPGFEALHRENYEVAYHLTTAIGATHMLQMGAHQPEFVAIILRCLHEATEHEQRAAGHLRQMHGAASAQVRPLVEQMQGHVQRTVGQMQAAQGLLNQQLGPEMVRRLHTWAEQQGD